MMRRGKGVLGGEINANIDPGEGAMLPVPSVHWVLKLKTSSMAVDEREDYRIPKRIGRGCRRF